MTRLPHHAENDLCAAALRGDLEAMQRCLDNGADLNTCPQNGDSTLYHALSSDRLEHIEFLIKKGANMTWYDKHGISIFQHVLLRGRLNQVEIFLKNGALATSHPESIKLETRKHIVAFLINRAAKFNLPESNFSTVLMFAILHDEKMALEILKKDTSLEINAFHPLGFTLLHVAAIRNRMEVLKKLIKYGAEVNIMALEKRTALYEAVVNGNFEMVRFLLDNGASLKLDYENSKCNPLHWAASVGKFDIVELLIKEGVDVNAQDSEGRTPLNWVCYPCDRINEDADADADEDERDDEEEDDGTEEEDAYPRTVDQIQEDCRKTIILLLDRGADPKIGDKGGRTALHAACKERNLNFVQLLLVGKIQNNSVCNEKCTFFHPECNKVFRITEMLPANELYRTKNCFHIKASKLFRKLKEASLFLEGKAYLNIRNNNNRTALHIAVINGCDDIVEFLLKYQIDVNVIDVNGCSPLHLALRYYYIYNEPVDFKNAKLLTETIAIRKTNEEVVNEGDLKLVKSASLHDHYEKCKKEIFEMKSKKIINDSFVSFYDFFSKDVTKLAKIANNSSIMLRLKSQDYFRDFPIYGSLLERRIGLGELRQIMVQVSELVFKSIPFKKVKKLPKFIVRDILDYLTNEDLLIFVMSIIPMSTTFGYNVCKMEDDRASKI